MRAEDLIPGDVVISNVPNIVEVWDQPHCISNIVTTRGKTVLTFTDSKVAEVVGSSTFFKLYDEGPGIPL